jgi:hypothetical protein
VGLSKGGIIKLQRKSKFSKRNCTNLYRDDSLTQSPGVSGPQRINLINEIYGVGKRKGLKIAIYINVLTP